MSSVQIEQKSYEMPPKEGISLAPFLTVANIERSARSTKKCSALASEPGRRQRAWVPSACEYLDDSERGGGPTPDKPTVTLCVPDPNHINSFMNFRVADIQACYELWKIEERSSSRSPSPNMARYAATSAILTATLSRSDRAPITYG